MNRLTIVTSSSGDADDTDVRVYPASANKVQLVFAFTDRQFSLVCDLFTLRQLVVEADRQLTHHAEELEDHGGG